MAEGAEAAVEDPPADAAAVGEKTYELITGVRPQFGEGREEMGNGAYYEGAFRYAKRHGHGVLVSNAEGTEFYEGEFCSDFPEGQGRKVWPDGNTYEGQWREGRKEGDGVLEEASGRKYSGQWKDGKRDGIGTQVFDEISRYEGRWQNGLQHGTGKYFDSRAETVYEGKWKNGHYDGEGLLRHKDGAREKQTYENGMLKHREVLPMPTEYVPIQKDR